MEWFSVASCLCTLLHLFVFPMKAKLKATLNFFSRCPLPPCFDASSPMTLHPWSRVCSLGLHLTRERALPVHTAERRGRQVHGEGTGPSPSLPPVSRGPGDVSCTLQFQGVPVPKGSGPTASHPRTFSPCWSVWQGSNLGEEEEEEEEEEDEQEQVLEQVEEV